MPDVLTVIPEVRGCYEIANEMADFFFSEIQKLDVERNTDTATEFGISRKEKMYGLKAFDTDTLEERRLRIKIHETFYKTLNIYNLEDTLRKLTDGDAKVDIDKVNKSVLVTIGLSSFKKLLQIKNFIRKYIPVDWSGEETVLYNRFSQYSGYTFSQMSDKTFNELKKEV